MNTEETRNILHAINVNYPNAYSKYSKQDKDQLVMLWQSAFAKSDAQAVFNALLKFISSDIKGFPPTIGMLKEIMVEDLPIHLEDPESIWPDLLPLAKCDASMCRENYKSLSYNTQKALGGWAKLNEIAWADQKKAEWLKKEFVDRYRKIQEEDHTGLLSGRFTLGYVKKKSELPEEALLEWKDSQKLLIGGSND